MAYQRITVVDYVDKMDAAKYHNVEDGIDERIAAHNSLASNVTTLSDNIDTHTSAISSINADIDDLQDVDEALDDRVTAIEAQIGGGSSATMTASNTTGWISNSFATGQNVNISFTWSSVESSLPTGNGSVTITVNSILKYQGSIAQGSISFNIKDYLSNGNNNITVKIFDVYGTFKTFKLTVNIVSLSITSTFDFGIVRGNDAIQFPCLVKGSVSKTIHFKIDGTETYSDTSTVATKNYLIPIASQTHGVHTIDCYVTATVGTSSIESNHITGSVIWYKTSGTTVLKVDFPSSTAYNQYDVYGFTYQIYSDQALENNVKIKVNDGTADETLVDANVDRTVHYFETRIKKSGTITYKVNSTTKALTVTAKSLPVSVETQGIEMYLKAEGKTQLLNPNQWTDSYGTTTTFTSTPIWDNNSETGTRLILDNNSATVVRKPFSGNITQTGKTIEFDFEIHDMTSLSEVVISCLSGGIGVKVTNQDFDLSSSSLDVKQYFNTGERVHITYVIEPSSSNKFIKLYINGVLSQLQLYGTSEIFTQATPVDITLSASGCKLYVYNLLSYNTALDAETVLNNFIATHENVDELLEIYSRCDVMTNGSIDRSKLNDGCAYIILETPNAGQELPQTKADPQIINMNYVDPHDNTRSWSATGLKCKIQGTSSATYIRKNYTLDCSVEGCQMFDYVGSSISGFALDSTKNILEKVFVIKKNLASSEQVNNIVSQKFANDNAPVLTPRQQQLTGGVQANFGYPIAVWWKNNQGVEQFWGIYTMNTGKDSQQYFGWNELDAYISLEDNTSQLTAFRTNVLPNNWEDYLEESNPVATSTDNTKTYIQAFLNWINTCNPSTATGRSIPAVTYEGVTYTTDSAAYRRARFKATASEHIVIDSCLYYYCMIELLLGVDSMQKNMMWTYFAPTVDND